MCIDQTFRPDQKSGSGSFARAIGISAFSKMRCLDPPALDTREALAELLPLQYLPLLHCPQAPSPFPTRRITHFPADPRSPVPLTSYLPEWSNWRWGTFIGGSELEPTSIQLPSC